MRTIYPWLQQSRALPMAALLAVVSSGVMSGCEPKKPARLALDPRGPFRMTRIGQSEQVKPMAYDEANLPFVQALDVAYKSSDDTVAKVSSAGVIEATGSGSAVITATTEGLSATAAVEVLVVGSVEIVGDPPAKLRYGGKDITLDVVVKDDKGREIPKPKLSFSASDYCVQVSPDGVVHPLTIGKCDVIVRSADQSASHTFEVK